MRGVRGERGKKGKERGRRRGAVREGARSACGGEGVWERGAEGAERKGKECIIVYLCKKVSYGTTPPPTPSILRGLARGGS